MLTFDSFRFFDLDSSANVILQSGLLSRYLDNEPVERKAKGDDGIVKMGPKKRGAKKAAAGAGDPQGQV